MTVLSADEALLGNANAFGVYVAPVGTAAPTGPSLDAAWKTLGYIHEDGVKIQPERETEGLKAWQSASPIKNVLTAFNISIELSLLQHNETTLAHYWGQAVPTVVDGEVTLDVRTTGSGPETSLIVDTKDGDRIARYHFYKVQVGEVGELEIAAGGFQALPVTFTALDPGTGIPATIYLLDAAGV